MSWNREGLAWAAGLYDGEGSLSWCKSGTGKPRQYYRLNMQLVQTNVSVLERLQETLNAGVIYGPYRQGRVNHKDYWQWHVDAFENIQYVICRLWPWLSQPKRDQARKSLLAYRAYCAQPQLPKGPRPKGKPAK